MKHWRSFTFYAILGYFGEANEVRKSALARMVANASSTSEDLATIDFVAAATIFHVNVLVHAESSWTVYNSDIVEKERVRLTSIWRNGLSIS